MRYNLILWDFDGTLVDTSQGIFESLHYAFSHMQMPPPSQAVLSRFIGPPLLQIFEQVVGLSHEEGLRAVEFYREDYRGRGLFQAEVYAGIPELVRELRARGVKHAVATLKPEHMAARLLDHFGLTELFDVCCGSEENSPPGLDKAQIIRTAAGKLGLPLDEHAVMIGDTVHDAVGAHKAGIDFVAAAYGYGFAHAGDPLPPEALAAQSVSHLREILLAD